MLGWADLQAFHFWTPFSVLLRGWGCPQFCILTRGEEVSGEEASFPDLQELASMIVKHWAGTRALCDLARAVRYFELEINGRKTPISEDIPSATFLQSQKPKN
jgi:hypothetical protein